ncbi:Type I restriction-modification system, restriction subunit R [hydrothermal vent metagenome]|uniref:Type I restriction-modification system, restriction subunit R n=1 Tax=hydrothermal vent metagenome TaxID=652676 RepID=A0A3B1AXI7_9ZZZZ
MPTINQTPEQIARDKIDARLVEAGWIVQDKKAFDPNAGPGVAVREWTTNVGPVDYALFIGTQAVGIIEAKPDSWGHKITTVEEQSTGYADAQLKWVEKGNPLPFVYESTSEITRFTDRRDPKPRSREVFNFHRPETLKDWLEKGDSLLTRLQSLPALNHAGLRDCQITAIENLEVSFKEGRPRALIQMATGAGKTFTAITSMYRLLKFADANRILFLVDTKNLGEQAEQELMAYVPNDDNRKFTELYNVRRLSSSHVPKDAQVCISTIQRMYAILKGEELDEAAEEENPAESALKPKEPLPVVYNPKVTPEFFDFVIIDECHRSIYNLWQQVLDYFDAFLVGLTATPDNRTYGFFKRNVVSEYTHERAVADGVNVGNEIYVIETQVTKGITTIKAEQQIEKRERITRARRWETQDEDEAYNIKQLDKKIVNPDQIRTVIKTFRDKLPEIFPGRTHVPKTLIFAKTDSHADDIIQTVREEFGEGNEFCKKVTYKADEDPKSVLAAFRTTYNPRIAVTVDMIATGTDVKPLECLLFMRDVKSKNYFEQMKGRGTRTLGKDDLQKVTPDAIGAKSHYVIVDAIGVTKTIKTTSQPLITKPTIPFKDLAMGVMMGSARDADTVSSLAGRLARLNTQLDPEDHKKIEDKTGGLPLTTIVGSLFDAIDADNVEAQAKANTGNPAPTDEDMKTAQNQLVAEAAKIFNGELIDTLENIRQDKAQTIDHDNLDKVLTAEWDGDATENAEALISEMRDYFIDHKDTLTALTIFFDQPYRRREVTFQMITEVLEKLRTDRPKLAPLRVFNAFGLLDSYNGKQPVNELTALVALLRRITEIDDSIAPYSETVRQNFQTWIMHHHRGAGQKFNDEQMNWLRMIRDHVITSFHMDRTDLDMSPFDAKGGMGKMYQLFGGDMDSVINELNEALAA